MMTSEEISKDPTIGGSLKLFHGLKSAGGAVVRPTFFSFNMCFRIIPGLASNILLPLRIQFPKIMPISQQFAPIPAAKYGSEFPCSSGRPLEMIQEWLLTPLTILFLQCPCDVFVSAVFIFWRKIIVTIHKILSSPLYKATPSALARCSIASAKPAAQAAEVRMI